MDYKNEDTTVNTMTCRAASQRVKYTDPHHGVGDTGHAVASWKTAKPADPSLIPEGENQLHKDVLCSLHSSHDDDDDT